ncbi:neuronal cell adhesion molecule a isoform X13 [Electrophorus electricus]|uniref:neuronal cell adhesion molecule a isoform X13 n=1 Tax=Electrophorus electricus TaxID=8005 RepID=UPI0015CFA749|nr:neuronal cell adhesion molecule a isoform X13 [Electrophorus electricus]
MNRKRKYALCGGVVMVLLLGHMTTALEVPLDSKFLEGLPQPPTITHQSPKDYIIDPRENIVIHCEAKGKPHPSFSWTRNGTHFDMDKDPKVTMNPNSGTLVIDTSGEKAEVYEGVYQCTARNQHGTAVSNNIVIRQSKSPLWSKERNEPITVQVGVSLVLHCRPPAGLPPPIIFWMDNNFQRLPQNSRVSQALNGDLYFSNVLPEDTRSDYICYARFPHTQTIQQKQPITVTVLDVDTMNETVLAAYLNDTDILGDRLAMERPPSFMYPSGANSTTQVLRGETLELECIADGLPTPEISWAKDSGDLPKERLSFLNFQKTLRISEVTEADGGDYRCLARNHLDSTNHTITVVVKAAPFWISTPQNLILAPEESGMLTCLAGGNPKPTITWSINGIPIENSPNDPSRKIEDNRVILSNVQTGSSAVYQCNASNEFGYLLANAFVSVLAEPPRVLTPPNHIYQVISNRLAMLDCASFGSPIPKITWFKDGQTAVKDGDTYLLHENGTLQITAAQPLHSGKYTCVATNNQGSKENQVYLEVKEPTRILRQPEYKVVQRRGKAVFECKVTHDPTLILVMTWLKDNGELPDDDRFVVGSDSLTINNVMEQDEGTYMCIMNTTLDQDSASAMLTVVERPDPPRDLELTDQRERSVQLTWTPGDEHNSRIQEFLIQYEDSLHEPGTWNNLTVVAGTSTTVLLDLSPYVYYSFRVLALNNVGLSDPSHPSSQYRTNPAQPDENPSDVEVAGTEPNNMVISWRELTGLQANGPGLQYKVSWRRWDMGGDWTSVTVANISEYIVSGTPTFVPYEVTVQAENNYGAGPEPEVVLGYSGEGRPMTPPENVQVLVQNSTLAEVHWESIQPSAVRGRLQGYKVKYWKERSLLREDTHPEEPRIRIFSGNETKGHLPDLHPYSQYAISVLVFNSKGDGPPSADQHFETPEGVPGPPAFFRIRDSYLDSLTVEWGPPVDDNGHLIGYVLRYQPVNNTEEVKEMTFLANETSITLENLKYSTHYKFFLNGMTIKGSGPAITKAITIMDEAMTSRQVDIATQGWFIGLMCAIALLILVLLIVCFIKRNKGGKYPVKEKEEAHQDPEIQPMKEDDGTFGEYRSLESDTEDHKPLKGSRSPSNGTVKKDDSDDSLVDYGEGGDGQFNEDGSFIGQYSGKKEKDTAEGNESSEAPSPVNAMNSFV